MRRTLSLRALVGAFAVACSCLAWNRCQQAAESFGADMNDGDLEEEDMSLMQINAGCILASQEINDELELLQVSEISTVQRGERVQRKEIAVKQGSETAPAGSVAVPSLVVDTRESDDEESLLQTRASASATVTAVHELKHVVSERSPAVNRTAPAAHELTSSELKMEPIGNVTLPASHKVASTASNGHVTALKKNEAVRGGMEMTQTHSMPVATGKRGAGTATKTWEDALEDAGDKMSMLQQGVENIVANTSQEFSNAATVVEKVVVNATKEYPEVYQKLSAAAKVAQGLVAKAAQPLASKTPAEALQKHEQIARMRNIVGWVSIGALSVLILVALFFSTRRKKLSSDFASQAQVNEAS